MIPNSIANITSDRQNDFFLQKPQQETADYDRLATLLKQYLTIDQAKKFDEGYTFYKPSFNYKIFIKNIIILYINTVINHIKKNITDDTERQQTILLYENMQKTLISFFDTILIAAEKTTTEENNIDVQDISCILLGYATETLKRAHNNKHSKD
jgi:hypothetical protein